MTKLPTPVFKPYNSNRGFDMCIKAILVYGGTSYTKGDGKGVRSGVSKNLVFG